MNEDNKILERAINTSAACLLPSLLSNFDANPLSHDEFNEFREILFDQLHLLLDILYQNRNLLNDKTFDNQHVQLRVNFLLLACEQTEPNPFFQTDDKILIASLKKIFDDNLEYIDENVMKKVIQRYKETLCKEKWKKELGLVHGFPKFVEILLKNKSDLVDADVMMFTLSVGSNLLAHFDPHYKTIGLKIYRHLVEFGERKLLENLNIHQVIFSESLKMIQKSNDHDFIDHIYECLLNAVSIEDKIVRDSKWCKFDDVMDKIIFQFGMESDVKISSLILNKILKFCFMFYGKFESPTSFNEVDLKDYFKTLRTTTNVENLRTLRWIKKLMQMMIQESTSLLNKSEDCFNFLICFHSIYIVTIANVDPTIIEPQLTEFTMKMILMLMKVAKLFRKEPKIINSIILFLETFKDHQADNKEFIKCFYEIKNHEIFK